MEWACELQRDAVSCQNTGTIVDATIIGASPAHQEIQTRPETLEMHLYLRAQQW